MDARATADSERHLQGLDGLRGLAVAAVVAFHLDESALPGGFLGVSLFFALSGFVLTIGALSEHARTGRFDVRAFWVRRLRRLLPASMICLAVVMVAWPVAGWGSVASDVRWASAQVTNWVRIVRVEPYGTNGDASPLVHFWSLAVEQQFYWIFPVIVVAGLRSRRRLAGLLGGLVAASIVATVIWSDDSLVVYFSTFTRMGEIALGALAAMVYARRTQFGRATGFVAIVAGGCVIASMALVTLDDALLSRGGLLLFGALSALLVGCVASTPPLGRLLDRAPLRWIGRRAYGIYLVHWPVIVACREVGIGTVTTAVVTVTVTLALSAVSFTFVEEPIRRSVRIRRPWAVSIAAMALVASLSPVIPVAEVPAQVGFAEAVSIFESDGADRPVSSTTEPTTESTTGSVPQSDPVGARTPLSFVIVGDSKALLLALSADRRDSTTTEYRGGWARLGCPLERGTRFRHLPRESDGVGLADCDWTGQLSSLVQPLAPVDVALVYFGSWDVAQLQGPCCGGDWATLGDGARRDWAADEIDAMVAELTSAGVRKVALVTLLQPDATVSAVEVDHYNQLLRDAALRQPDTVTVIDLAAWFRSRPDLATLLPDGTHTTWGEHGGRDSGRIVFDQFLDGAIVAAAR